MIDTIGGLCFRKKRVDRRCCSWRLCAVEALRVEVNGDRKEML
ncbi:MAG: hypothetical protein ACLSHC_14110 [Bilophila wadsworthia]